MKIVQTFWTGSSSGAKLSDITGGWLSPEYHWMGWALSCLQANRFFDRVELVTDNKGKEILVDRFELPYTSVSTALEGALDEAPPELFSLAKLFTYGRQAEPFMHIDGDVFLFQKPSPEWLDSPLLAQNIDRNLLFYEQTLDKINECFSFIPACMKKGYYKPGAIEAANAGVFGGSNLSFIQEYCAAGFEFISRNRQDIGRFPVGNLNFIFEQYLLFCLAKEKSVEIAYLIPDVVDSLWYQPVVRFQDLPHITMAHPLGGFKKSALICRHVAMKLRKEYPAYYYKILRLMKEGVIHSRVYQQEGFIEVAEKINAGREITTGDDGQVKHRKDDILVSDLFEDCFRRTEEAIRYFINDGLLAPKPDRQKEAWNTDFLSVVNTITDERAKEVLGEVYLLDKERREVTLESLVHTDSIIALYKKEIQNYNRSQQLFALFDEQLQAIQVALNNDVRVVDLRWELPFETASKFRKLLQDSRQQEEAFYQVALIPGALWLQVEEYYLDNLDSIVVNCCTEATRICNILSAVSEYFDPEEMVASGESFKNLIYSVLKRLCYANILHIT